MTAPNRQNVSPRAAELIAQIYSKHGAGCCWHCVLDDDNWDRDCYPKREFIADSCECGACLELLDLDPSPSILYRAYQKASRKALGS